MRFYVLNQSQVMIAIAVALVSLAAVIWLIAYACRVFGETVQRTTVQHPELVCRFCKSKAVHPSFRSGVLDQIFWRLSFQPYRCDVCSWRFYVHRSTS